MKSASETAVLAPTAGISVPAAGAVESSVVAMRAPLCSAHSSWQAGAVSETASAGPSAGACVASARAGGDKPGRRRPRTMEHGDVVEDEAVGDGVVGAESAAWGGVAAGAEQAGSPTGGCREGILAGGGVREGGALPMLEVTARGADEAEVEPGKAGMEASAAQAELLRSA